LRKIVFEEPATAQAVKNFPALFETWRVIILFTTQFLRFILILFFIGSLPFPHPHIHVGFSTKVLGCLLSVCNLQCTPLTLSFSVSSPRCLIS